MENSNWSRVEGMIIARRLDPQTMTDYLAERGVLAQLDWFKDTPQMMGIRIGLDGDRVAGPGLLPTDPGTLCWSFILWGFAPAFAVVYTVLAAVALAHSAVSLRRRYRDLTALDEAQG